MLELGPTEQNIAKQAIRAGEPIPERIANAPQLSLGSIFYLQAFFDLDSERPQGYSTPGRIPWSAIVGYGEYHGLTPEEIDVLVHYVRALDNENLRWISERAE
jgi:hypothetical protein